MGFFFLAQIFSRELFFGAKFEDFGVGTNRNHPGVNFGVKRRRFGVRTSRFESFLAKKPQKRGNETKIDQNREILGVKKEKFLFVGVGTGKNLIFGRFLG